MKPHSFFLLLIIVTFFSCNSKVSKETYSSIQIKGNEISNLTQAALLSNVGKAIQKGGPQFAIEFCNLKASSIVDSLSQLGDYNISRVSIKNRNLENGLQGKQEKELWEIFEKSNASDTIIQTSKKLVYYKRINLALPACLKCHGNTKSDINAATRDKLSELYPNDLATGYKLNDFRGLWKIEFNNN